MFKINQSLIGRIQISRPVTRSGEPKRPPTGCTVEAGTVCDSPFGVRFGSWEGERLFYITALGRVALFFAGSIGGRFKKDNQRRFDSFLQLVSSLNPTKTVQRAHDGRQHTQSNRTNGQIWNGLRTDVPE